MTLPVHRKIRTRNIQDHFSTRMLHKSTNHWQYCYLTQSRSLKKLSSNTKAGMHVFENPSTASALRKNVNSCHHGDKALPVRDPRKVWDEPGWERPVVLTSACSGRVHPQAEKWQSTCIPAWNRTSVTFQCLRRLYLPPGRRKEESPSKSRTSGLKSLNMLQKLMLDMAKKHFMRSRPYTVLNFSNTDLIDPPALHVHQTTRKEKRPDERWIRVFMLAVGKSD